MTDPTGLNLHQDEALFREAVSFTAARTGFTQRLIEKDYFCAVLLAYLAEHGGDPLVFKGGTCLAKVHANFYRLSEDLDFAIPQPVDATRRQRRQAVAQITKAVANITAHAPQIDVVEALQGANNSTQYNGLVAYRSPVTGQRESILIEVSIREPLLMLAEKVSAKTLLLDPISGSAAVPKVDVRSIALPEAMAEKLRAALSRKEVAIRDFYDLDHAAQQLNLELDGDQMLEMVRLKMSVPGNLPVNVGDSRLAELRQQLDTRLRTVLRDSDFEAFDLDRAIRLVVGLAQRLGP